MGEEAKISKSCVAEEGWEGTRAASECPGEAHCVREDAGGARMRRAGQSRQHRWGISKKGLLATYPAQPRARPARGHGCILVKQSGGAAPLPLRSPLLPSPRGCTRGLGTWVVPPSPEAVTLPFRPCQPPSLCIGGVFQGQRVTTSCAKDAALPGYFFLFSLSCFCANAALPTFHPTFNRGGDGDSNLL